VNRSDAPQTDAPEGLCARHGIPIAVYRDTLLPFSETFIKSQAESLTAFVPYYTGSRILPHIPLPQDRTFVLNRGSAAGRFRELAFKATGISPYLRSALTRAGVRLLHAHFGPDAALALPIAKALDIPLVVSFHGYDATKSAARFRSRTERLFLRRRALIAREAHLIIAVSDFIRGRLLESGFPPEKVLVHYTGVDTAYFRPNKKERLPVVLFVGRLVELKGCEYLIRAFSVVQEEIPEAMLVIIGDGPLRSTLDGLAKSVLRNYQFLGAQPQSSVREWMGKARVFSVPSVVAPTGAAEGFGLVFAEAQAMGLPVVSFATGGIPEAVTHGRTGFLASPGDWRTLASRLVLLLKDHDLAQAFGMQGRRHVVERFDLSRQARRLEELYFSVLGTRKAQ
jgi:glycosyltransferase involved in cell wall biosynthesis